MRKSMKYRRLFKPVTFNSDGISHECPKKCDVTISNCKKCEHHEATGHFTVYCSYNPKKEGVL